MKSSADNTLIGSTGLPFYAVVTSFLRHACLPLLKSNGICAARAQPSGKADESNRNLYDHSGETSLVEPQKTAVEVCLNLGSGPRQQETAFPSLVMDEIYEGPLCLMLVFASFFLFVYPFP